jgi:hypothetical protein
MAEGGQPPSVPVVRRPAPDGINRWWPRQSTVIGGLLILIGAVLLIGNVVRIDLGRYGWPLFVIAPGILLIVLALTASGFVKEGLAIAGSIVTVTGLILLYQNSTDHFESWAYAWALVFPAAVGAGMIIYGVAAQRPGNVRAGTRLVAIGVVLFLLGAAFFEGVIGLGGYEFSRPSGAVVGGVIILLGAVLLAVNLASRRRGPG